MSQGTPFSDLGNAPDTVFSQGSWPPSRERQVSNKMPFSRLLYQVGTAASECVVSCPEGCSSGQLLVPGGRVGGGRIEQQFGLGVGEPVPGDRRA